MICDKCGGIVYQNMSCSLCGYDNTNVDYDSKNIARMVPFATKSLRLIVSMWLIILYNALSILWIIISQLLIIISHSFITYLLVLIGIIEAFGLNPSKFFTFVIVISLCKIIFMHGLEIVFCLFILKLRKKALICYLIITAISSIPQILEFNFVPVILKAAFLYFVFKKDWKKFK